MPVKKGHDLQKVVLSTTGLGMMLLLLILLNVIISYANIRWDTTEDRIFSLSQGSKNIVANLDEPVTVKFFYNRSNPNFPRNLKLYAKRVRDFLAEYEYASDGRVVVEEYDPRVDSDEEEWAQRYGLRPVQAPSAGKIYCGLVFLAGDREELIPFLNLGRQELLEYDITRIIHDLQFPGKKILGIITDLPVFGSKDTMMTREFGGEPPWVFVTELKKTYEVREIDPLAKEIDADLDLLMIVHPRKLTPSLKYGVDQYILGGGKALVFVDPYCLSDQSPAQFMQPPISALPDFFKAWNLSMETTMVAADLGQSTRMRVRGGAIDDSPVVISPRGKAFNRESVVTSQLESMLFGFSGAIKQEADSTYEFEPLVQTTENADLVPIIKVRTGSAAIRKNFTPAEERLILAGWLRGTLKTAFPSGPPKQKGPKAESEESSTEPDEAEKKHLGESTTTSSIIIAADVDLLADQFYVRQRGFSNQSVSEMINDNFNFVANACEILTGGDELIGLRSRGRFQRPFTTVLELQRRAQDRWLAKEQELAKEFDETNLRLRQLQVQKDDSQRMILTPEQEAEIEKFEERKQEINRELKRVRKNLRADIETLGTRLKAINIFLMPLCIAIAGLGFALYKQRRMKKP